MEQHIKYHVIDMTRDKSNLLIVTICIFVALVCVLIISLRGEIVQKQNNKQVPVRQELRYQMVILQQQMELLRLQACSDAQIKYNKCQVDWNSGIVSEIVENKDKNKRQ